jgi:hypothetical protein
MWTYRALFRSHYVADSVISSHQFCEISYQRRFSTTEGSSDFQKPIIRSQVSQTGSFLVSGLSGNLLPEGQHVIARIPLAAKTVDW